MTPDHIAQIAAYYGQRLTYSEQMEDGDASHYDSLKHNCLWSAFFAVVTDPVVISGKCQLLNVKLHLRPLSALTDEQLRELFGVAVNTKHAAHSVQVKNAATHKEVKGLFGETEYELFFDGTEDGLNGVVSASFEWADVKLDAGINVGPLTRRLQAWGYYLPGVIDECYVKLIEP